MALAMYCDILFSRTIYTFSAFIMSKLTWRGGAFAVWHCLLYNKLILQILHPYLLSFAMVSHSLTSNEHEQEDARRALPFVLPASPSQNEYFHQLFPKVPEIYHLIQGQHIGRSLDWGRIIIVQNVDYACAWERGVLAQGRLYIAEGHLCFYANVLGWISNVGLVQVARSFSIDTDASFRSARSLSYLFMMSPALKKE